MSRSKESSFLLAFYPGTLEDLPVISPVAAHAASLAKLKALGEEELVEAVRSDVFLSAKLIGVSNDPTYHLSHEPCFSVREAIARVGHEYASALVANAEQLTDSSEIEAARALWVHSCVVAQLAEALAGKASKVALSPEAVHSFALVHDIGVLVAADFERHRFSEIVGTFQSRETRHDDHGSLAQPLGQFWFVPAAIREVMRWHHSPSQCPSLDVAPVLALLHVSHAIADGATVDDVETSPELQAAIGTAGLAPAVAVKALASPAQFQARLLSFADRRASAHKG